MNWFTDDLKILKSIFNKTKKEFKETCQENSFCNPWVFIQISEISEIIDMNESILIHRLKYLNSKYSFKEPINQTNTYLFDIHGPNTLSKVNFPFLCSVISKLEDDEKSLKHTRWIAYASFIISLITIVIKLSD